MNLSLLVKRDVWPAFVHGVLQEPLKKSVWISNLRPGLSSCTKRHSNKAIESPVLASNLSLVHIDGLHVT